MELVRYIHLNPLRARLVADIKALDKYPFCGHAVIMGKKKKEWQDDAYVLKLFDKRDQLRGDVTKYLFKKASRMVSAPNSPEEGSSEAAAAGL